MVVLGPADGQIEVRLVKPPFDATEPIYFDEFEKLGTAHPEKLRYESLRYIASENTAYAIEVTLKKGFSYGTFLGIRVQVHDKVRKVQIGNRGFCKANSEDLLNEDKKILITSLRNVIFDGKARDNVNLSFSGLATDETLSKETDVPGVEPADIGGFIIKVNKYKDPKWTVYSETKFKEKQRQFEAKLTAQVSKIDERSFTKEGITHKLGLEGGIERPLKPLKHAGWVYSCSEAVFFNYTCRSSAFFERNSIFKCPIPMECQPWNSLTNHERRTCFKSLQNYDKERALKQKVLEAGSGADKIAIQRQLLELGDVPNRWRAWNHLYKREVQGLFENLQLRRKSWERGEIPPEDRKPKIEITPLNPRNQSSAPLVSQPTIKEEPDDAPTLPKIQKPQASIIILDDSDSPPRSNKRSAASLSTTFAATMKTEPVDLDNLSASASANDQDDSNGGPAKKIKLEPGTAPIVVEGDQLLNQLKQEDEREEEELQVLQRIAEMFRERSERKEKIAALEARASAIPGKGGRS